ncbi:uncharacterized protein LOC143018119 [Oratosquilla oratoria]|uniref:uncharacterized protein LOC143018119 n=1 Tax=Oratosquilla oratoria TaxID=337810 RepID=UPI003F7624DC
MTEQPFLGSHTAHLHGGGAKKRRPKRCSSPTKPLVGNRPHQGISCAVETTSKSKCNWHAGIALRGSECWTDRRLIRSIVSFQIRHPIYKQAKKKQIDRAMFHNQDKLTELQTALHSKSTIAPLMSAGGATLIKDRKGIPDRWVEYLSSLLNQNNPIEPTFTDRLPNLPLLKNLDLTPSFTETLKACNSLKNNKAPGPDGIPGELFNLGGHIVMKRLHLMIQIFWEAGYIPQSLKDPLIVMIYKRKGQKSECENYREISLLDVVGKVFA